MFLLFRLIGFRFFVGGFVLWIYLKVVFKRFLYSFFFIIIYIFLGFWVEEKGREEEFIIGGKCLWRGIVRGFVDVEG